ncbi:MAG TPA: outer membrane lipoprotein carrier protein LolA [Candidatus Dormibacteraeota bacterium]|nr:outer membrane lipoprotein carrier protein LolA [Candidatus Dormibacteraeota bacterium]
MKKIVKALVILAAAIVCCHAIRGAEPSPLLQQWFAAQTNLHTWSADAIQTRVIKTFAQPLVSTGKVWVVTPDHFRWELGKPAQTIALRQPDQLMLVYPRLKRAEKYPLNDKQPGPWRDALALMEASFPHSRAELESEFLIGGINESNGVVELRLQPKSLFARKFMTELRIGYRTADFAPAFTDMKFSDGSSMRNDFSNSITNAPIPPSIFQFELGSDFKVVEPLKK